MEKITSNKTIITSFIVLVVLVGLSIAIYSIANRQNTNISPVAASNEKAETMPNNDAYAAIDSSDIRMIKSTADIRWDAKDPYYGYKTAPVVALVKIDSIEGGRTQSPITNSPTFPTTYGKLTVLDVYKGDIKVDRQVTYARLGGTVTQEQYINAMNKEQKEKYLRNSSKDTHKKKYVSEKIEDDIDIKVNKRYIALINPQTSKDGKLTEYYLEGLQYGLREVRGKGKSIEALNNVSKSWEKPDKFIKTK